MTDEDSSLAISVARAVEQHPIAPYCPIQRQTWSIIVSQQTLQILAVCTQKKFCYPHTKPIGVPNEPKIQLAMPHHSRGEPPLPAWSWSSCTTVLMQEEGRGTLCMDPRTRRAGKRGPGPPMQYQMQLARVQLLFALVRLPQSLALQGGVGWAQSDSLQPKQPALLEPARQHLGLVHAGLHEYLSLALPTIHILCTFILPAIHGPRQQRTSLVPHRTFSLAC